jgi:hypothetical protein
MSDDLVDIADEDVNRSERRDSIGKQTLDLGDNGDIRLSRERVAACGLDFGDDALGAWSATREVTTTEVPAAAIAFAMPAPMPLAAPVTSATLPAREPSSAAL